MSSDKDAFLTEYNTLKSGILEIKNTLKEEKKHLAINDPQA